VKTKSREIWAFTSSAAGFRAHRRSGYGHGTEATVETLMHTIHAHPTLYEAVGEAFNAVDGLQINA